MPTPSVHLPSTVLEECAPEVRSGLSQLLRAYDYARDLECSLWDFSVEMERLLALGMTTSDLRWLIKRGYLSHAREVTGPHDTDRRFDPQPQNLAFSRNVCFVLTAEGLAMLGRDVSGDDVAMTLDGSGHNEAARELKAARFETPAIELPERTNLRRLTVAAIPNWDRDTRTFLVGEHLVKQFRVPSPNQEAVLDAFQEEGWPRSVDDPLPPVPDQQPKRRLRDTVKSLNLNQVSRVIHFRGDGTGQRVCWELLIDTSTHSGTSESRPFRRAA